MVAYVYILSSGRNGTFYVGVTGDIARRIHEHRTDAVDGFTKKYRVHRLVYYEMHEDIREAIRREKSIKRWKRSMKMEMIERLNPEWEDLYHDLNR